MKKSHYIALFFVSVLAFIIFNLFSSADSQITKVKENVVLKIENITITKENKKLKVENVQLKTTVKNLQNEIQKVDSVKEIPVSKPVIRYAQPVYESYKLYSDELSDTTQGE